MQGRSFLFVCGDIGGARAQVPVAKALVDMGHKVDICVDGEGMAANVFQSEKLDYHVRFSGRFEPNLPLDMYFDLNGKPVYNIVLVNTCASASAVLEKVANDVRHDNDYTKLVMGADGFFNHAMPKWQAVKTKQWFAITEGHAQAIRELRPGVQVHVVGQPAFDVIFDLIPRKDEIRAQRRNEICVGRDEKVYLWWSQGMPEMIEEDVEMATAAIQAIGRIHKSRSLDVPTFIPRIHPKLDKVRPGYVESIRKTIDEKCRVHGVSMYCVDKMPSEELCLAADVILSITCTEDIKSVLMGGPPVVHFLGPVARKWLEREVLLKPPHYLPDVAAGQALKVFEAEHMGQVIRAALDPVKRDMLAKACQPPTQRATDRVVQKLLELAQ